MTPDWEALAGQHARELVDRLRMEYEGGSISFTAEQLAQAASSVEGRTFQATEALTLLRAAGPWLEETTIEGELDPDFPDELPETVALFTWKGAQRRSLGWLLLVHGMNTAGAWQQQFAFDVGRWEGTAAPSFVHKYGWVVFGVVLPWRRGTLKEELRRRVVALSEKAAEQRLPARPAVVAHSFGTWLLGHVLLDQLDKGEPYDLRIGRVILTGSVLRPDFPWPELQRAGLVEDVLNHYATNDPVVPWAHRTIWDSGPSGRRGFDPAPSPHPVLGVLNVKAAPEGHSGALSERGRNRYYEQVWWPFLTNPDGQAAQRLTIEDPPRRWQQAWWLLRGTLFPLVAIPLLLALLLWGLVELGPALTWSRDRAADLLAVASRYLAWAGGGLLALYLAQKLWWWVSRR